MTNNAGSALPSPPFRKGSLQQQIAFRVGKTRPSTTLDREEGNEKRIPTAGFIRLFECNDREGQDAESGMCTTEKFLGGYDGGDEESRVSHCVDPI
jgi:hypothetical protein